MKLRSFRRGGVHPPENKISAGEEIVVFGVPVQVSIPLVQHIGAPATVVVMKGERVKVGQVIATATGVVSSNIHSSVSGVVKAVGELTDSSGLRREMVTIEVQGDEWQEDIDRSEDLIEKCDLTPAEIIYKITNAGVVGMGGATFPTQVKLSIPAGKRAEYLIINGVECEPYLTCDHRLMLERGEEILIGANIIAKALGAERIYIGIERNKADAIALLRELALKYDQTEVVGLKVKYPQGSEKQLIDAVLRREIPSGALPIDVGVVVHNVATALAVYEAVQKNKPLIERIVTVTGKGVEKPSNLKVRIGTSIREIVEHCAGTIEGKVINGGPMMGRAVSNLDAPVTKGTSGVVVMGAGESRRHKTEVCIKCGRCMSACPMGLEPYMICKLTQRRMNEELVSYYPNDCIECGSCSYVCPAAIPLLDHIRIGKAEVMKILRARK